MFLPHLHQLMWPSNAMITHTHTQFSLSENNFTSLRSTAHSSSVHLKRILNLGWSLYSHLYILKANAMAVNENHCRYKAYWEAQQFLTISRNILVTAEVKTLVKYPSTIENFTMRQCFLKKPVLEKWDVQMLLMTLIPTCFVCRDWRVLAEQFYRPHYSALENGSCRLTGVR